MLWTKRMTILIYIYIWTKKTLVWLGLYEIKLSEKVLERLGLRVSILYLQRYCCLQKPASFLRYSLPDQYLPKSRKPTWNSKTVLNPLNQFGWITRHLPILTKGQTTGFKWYGLISWIKFYSVKITLGYILSRHLSCSLQSNVIQSNPDFDIFGIGAKMKQWLLYFNFTTKLSNKSNIKWWFLFYADSLNRLKKKGGGNWKVFFYYFSNFRTLWSTA